MLRRLPTTTSRLLRSARLNFHSSPHLRAPCIYDDEREIRDQLIAEHNGQLYSLKKENQKLEEKLCQSRSLLAKHHFICKRYNVPVNHNDRKNTEAHLAEHKHHRLQEHNLLIKKIEDELTKSVMQIASLSTLHLQEIDACQRNLLAYPENLDESQQKLDKIAKELEELRAKKLKSPTEKKKIEALAWNWGAIAFNKGKKEYYLGIIDRLQKDRNSKIAALEKHVHDLEISLFSLKGIDTNSAGFLSDREKQIEISAKLRK